MRDVPFNKIFNNLKKEYKKVDDALNTPIECIKCGGNIQELGVSRIPNVCNVCAKLILQ